jgi:hypothetical protein
MAGEVRVDKKITNDHTFSYLLGIVKVRHVLTEQYFTGTSSSLSGKGEYIHTAKVYIFGKEVFSIEAYCGNVAKVFVEGDQLVGSTLLKKKRL